MDSEKRNLLVITSKEYLAPEVFKREVEFLTIVLYSERSTRDFYIANEVIDINKYKIIQKPNLVEQAIKKYGNKAFVFICNKN